MALTIRDMSEEAMQSFKALTGEKTASGALVQAAHIGVTASEELRKAKIRIADLERALTTRKQAIDRLKDSCLQLVELAAQEDLFGEAGE